MMMLQTRTTTCNNIRLGEGEAVTDESVCRQERQTFDSTALSAQFSSRAVHLSTVFFAAPFT
jgi:hypothetical protein